MSDIDRFKKENKIFIPSANAYKVVSPESFLTTNAYKKVFYPTKRLQKSIQVSGYDSIRDAVRIASSVKQSFQKNDMLLTNMAKSVSSFSAIAQNLGKSVLEQKKSFFPDSEPLLKDPSFCASSITAQQLRDIRESVNQNSDFMTDVSDALNRAAKINEKTLAALIDLNEKMAISNQAALETSQQAKAWHEEDSKSSKSESRKNWLNLFLVAATLIATIYSIFH